MTMRIGTALPADRIPAPPPDGDLCASGRFTSVMRVAKLVGSTGEFVCVVCEISRTELKLRLLHPLPGEARFALELPNGDCYFIEKVWERDREAGFRFSTPVEIRAFIHEATPYAKRQIRLRTALAATISAAGSIGEAVIRDLSQEGARIESNLPLGKFQRIRIDAEAIPSPIFASVHWTSQLEFGVLFQRAFKLEELAGIAWSLHDPADLGAARPRRFEVVRTTPQDA